MLNSLLILFLGLIVSTQLNLSSVQASHTKVFFNATGAAQPATIIAIPGGRYFTARFMVADFDDSNGLAGFDFSLTYDRRFFYIPAFWQIYYAVPQPGMVTVGPFLGNTGKPIECSAPRIEEVANKPYFESLYFTCVNLGPTPGPTGFGTLVNIQFLTADRQQYGQITTIDLETSTLANSTADPVEVPNTQIAATIQFAKCADLDGNGIVSIADISRIVGLYGTTPSSPNWDERADLNYSNSVSTADITIAVSEYQKTCPS